jgi:uncharacterized membrane protein YbaN (DUF454 family)
MRKLKKTLHISLAIVMLIIGACGIVLPILNGTLFVVLGLILLSFESRKVELFLERWSKKNIHVEKFYNKLNGFLRKLFRVDH